MGDVPIELTHVVKADPTLHVALNQPLMDGELPHAVVEPPRPPPTEPELRTRLSDALGARHQADDRLALAQSAVDRAKLHLRSCDATLRTFDGLDDRIAADVTAQLTDGDKARVEIDAGLNEQTVERERARVAYAAAVRASETLSAELALATRKRLEAVGALTKATEAVTAIRRAQMRNKSSPRWSYDAPHIGKRSMPVMGWQSGDRSVERLHQDPAAPIDLEVAAEPVPVPKPRLDYYGPGIVVMNGDGTTETLSMAEHAARHRARMIAGAGDNPAVSEERARELARRFVG